MGNTKLYWLNAIATCNGKPEKLYTYDSLKKGTLEEVKQQLEIWSQYGYTNIHWWLVTGDSDVVMYGAYTDTTMFIQGAKDNFANFKSSNKSIAQRCVDIIKRKGYWNLCMTFYKDYEDYKNQKEEVFKDSEDIDWDDLDQLTELNLYTEEEFNTLKEGMK